MAARTGKIRHDENTRAKIKASQIINRLQNHFFGEINLNQAQVAVGLGLLKKILPDLAATELSGEVARPTVIRAPATVSDSRSWLEQYGPDVGKIRGGDDPKPN